MTAGFRLAIAVDKRTADTLIRMNDAVRRVDSLLIELGRQGLQRATRSTSTELEAAAQVAHHARLTLVERELLGLRSLIERYLDRDPLFRTDQLVERVGRLSLRVDAVRERLDAGALPEHLVPLVGAPRRTYEPLDEGVIVHPIAMTGWVTDSDFVGVTVTCHSPTLSRTVAISQARPTHYFGTDPSRLAWQPVSDGVTESLRELAHASWRVEGTRVSADGRLSLGGDTYLVPAASVGAAAFTPYAVDDLLGVLQRLAQHGSDPLARWEPPWVYLEPAHLGRRTVDDTAGVARVPLTDAKGLRADLVVTLRAERKQRVRSMDHLGDPRHRPDGLVCRAHLAGDALSLEPLTAVFHEPVELTVGRRKLSTHLVHLDLEDLGRVQR